VGDHVLAVVALVPAGCACMQRELLQPNCSSVCCWQPIASLHKIHAALCNACAGSACCPAPLPVSCLFTI
jgi:hypothetical protein